MTNEIQQARRAAFEAWYVTDCFDNAQITITQQEVSELRGYHGDYRERAALHGKWIGFNAALDSLCIELPASISESVSPTGALLDAERNATIEACRAAIEQTNMGIKIK